MGDGLAVIFEISLNPDRTIMVGGPPNWKLRPTNAFLRLIEREPEAPEFIDNPGTNRAVAGGRCTLETTVGGIPDPVLQWYYNGEAIPGATGSIYPIPSLQSFHAGTYLVSAANTAGSVTSDPFELSPVAADLSDARLLNISTRARAGVGADVVIPGFVVSNEGPKRFLVRAIGPGLESFGVEGFLTDPEMRVFREGLELFANDDWGDVQGTTEVEAATSAVGAFPLAPGSSDAALLVTLGPGSYTVRASGPEEETGVVLVEVYEVPDSTQ